MEKQNVKVLKMPRCRRVHFNNLLIVSMLTILDILVNYTNGWF